MNKKKILIYSLLFLCGVIYNAVGCNHFDGLLDEGYAINCVARILDGHIPYKDYFSLITPASSYVGAVVYGLSGRNIMALRIFTACLAAMFPVVVFWGIENFGKSRVMAVTGYAATLFFGLSIYRMSFITYHYGANLFGVLSVFLLCVYFFGRKQKKVYPVLSGVCLSMSVLYKQTIGLYYALGFIICVTIMILADKRQKEVMNYIKWFAGSIGVMAFAYIAYFVANSAFGDMYRNLVEIPLNSFVGVRISPPSIKQAVKVFRDMNFETVVALEFWIEVIMLGMNAVIIVWKIAKKQLKVASVNVVLMVFAVCAFLHNFERFSFYQAVSTLPMIVIAVCVNSGAWKKTGRIDNILSAGVGILAAVLCFYSAELRIDRMNTVMANETVYFPETKLYTTEEQADRYTELFAAMDEFGISGGESYIYPMSPLIYELKDVENTTRQDLTIMGNFDQEGIGEIIDCLENTRYIIFDNYWDMDGIEFKTYASEIYDYVESNYEVVWMLDERMQILERRN